MTAFLYRGAHALAAVLLMVALGPSYARAQETTAALRVVEATPPGGEASGAVRGPAGGPAADLLDPADPVEGAGAGVAPADSLGTGFLARQLDFPRVRDAWAARAADVAALLRARGIDRLGQVFFRVFKQEQVLEVWARGPDGGPFTLLRQYPVCRISGRPGPKRRQGDGQIPEGFYDIDLFNPWSRFHLSMRVSYPNAVDRARGAGEPLGGDIFIHGGCASIGCVPVTDRWIEEVYVIAAEARDAGQRRIPVHIFPTRLDDSGLRRLEDSYGPRWRDLPFWRNLQEGYQAFERTHRLPRIGYRDGRYTFTLPAPPPAPILDAVAAVARVR